MENNASQPARPDLRLEWRGPGAQDAAAALQPVLEGLVARIFTRDPDLSPLAPLTLLVADDQAASLAELGSPAGGDLIQAVHGGDGTTLVFDGPRLAAVLAGESAEVERFVHLFHRELCRLRDLERRVASTATFPAGSLDSHIHGMALAAWSEYFSTRRAVWSLPADSQLLLPHLADLLTAIPPAAAEDLTLAMASGDLEQVFAKTLGRLTHLLQTAAHAMGYLAGLELTLDQLGGDMAGRVASSFLGPRWARLARMLDVLFGSAGVWDEVFLSNALRPDVLALFASLGLSLGEAEDGGVWLEPAPPVGALH
ncbi:MAG: hypothetical protein RBS40_08545 [Rhodocyclaceae bacterium]|jgi:hypothetical protein|nr:hypothetical protein [Rhodocyclaceae bacterium]